MALIELNMSGFTTRSATSKKYKIVPKANCSKSELDFGNGYHLCKVENIQEPIMTLSIKDVIDRLTEYRPDLIIDASDISLDGWRLDDYIKLDVVGTPHKEYIPFNNYSNEAMYQLLPIDTDSDLEDF